MLYLFLSLLALSSHFLDASFTPKKHQHDLHSLSSLNTLSFKNRVGKATIISDPIASLTRIICLLTNNHFSLVMNHPTIGLTDLHQYAHNLYIHKYLGEKPKPNKHRTKKQDIQHLKHPYGSSFSLCCSSPSHHSLIFMFPPASSFANLRSYPSISTSQAFSLGSFLTKGDYVKRSEDLDALCPDPRHSLERLLALFYNCHLMSSVYGLPTAIEYLHVVYPGIKVLNIDLDFKEDEEEKEREEDDQGSDQEAHEFSESEYSEQAVLGSLKHIAVKRLTMLRRGDLLGYNRFGYPVLFDLGNDESESEQDNDDSDMDDNVSILDSEAEAGDDSDLLLAPDFGIVLGLNQAKRTSVLSTKDDLMHNAYSKVSLNIAIFPLKTGCPCAAYPPLMSAAHLPWKNSNFEDMDSHSHKLSSLRRSGHIHGYSTYYSFISYELTHLLQIYSANEFRMDRLVSSCPHTLLDTIRLIRNQFYRFGKIQVWFDFLLNGNFNTNNQIIAPNIVKRLRTIEPRELLSHTSKVRKLTLPTNMESNRLLRQNQVWLTSCSLDGHTHIMDYFLQLPENFNTHRLFVSACVSERIAPYIMCGLHLKLLGIKSVALHEDLIKNSFARPAQAIFLQSDEHILVMVPWSRVSTHNLIAINTHGLMHIYSQVDGLLLPDDGSQIGIHKSENSEEDDSHEIRYRKPFYVVYEQPDIEKIIYQYYNIDPYF